MLFSKQIKIRPEKKGYHCGRFLAWATGRHSWLVDHSLKPKQFSTCNTCWFTSTGTKSRVIKKFIFIHCTL